MFFVGLFVGAAVGVVIGWALCLMLQTAARADEAEGEVG